MGEPQPPVRTVRFRDPVGSIRVGEWREDGFHAGGVTYDPDAVDLLPPSDPSKVVCVGLNYVDHADEVDLPIPDRPLIFLKPPSAVADPGAPIPLPGGRERFDPEAELGVVIGRQCRKLTTEEAMDAVAGFTCVNDLSNRDDQFEPADGMDLFRGKAFDGAAPIGPALVPAGAVPEDATIELQVNGEVRQRSSLDRLIFDVPTLLAEITELVTLEPGDVISTGTPAGVAPVDDGDRMAVEIEGVGVLENTVVRP